MKIRIRKLICISIISTLLLVLFGCGNKASRSDNNKQTNNTESSTSPSSQNNNSSQSDTETKTNNEQQASNTATQTQKDVLNKIGGKLNTGAPIMLPVEVTLEKGKYLTAATISEAWHYKVDFYDSNKPTEINSQSISKNNEILTVEGTEYKDEASAKAAINGYVKVDISKYSDMTIDLGHDIKALQEGAAGHGYISWNEGLWSLRIDSPNDSKYINKKYADSKQLAKNIVEYLDKYMLPAPKNIGVINVDNWNNNQGTTIQWQANKVVYKIWSKDPMIALKAAVVMKVK